MKVGSPISTEWMFCLIAGFLMQQIATVSAVYSMSQTCEQIPKGFIADPNDCQNYGYCLNGTLIGIKPCPTGYIYNARKAICDLPSADACAVSNAANVCKFAADRSFVADPSSCNNYYYCNNKVAESRQCPKNQLYDPKRTRCVWSDSSSSKCEANSICRLLPDGTFAGDPDYCGQYIACNNGVGVSGKCPKNTYFNKRIGMCQDDNPCQTPTPVGIGLGIMTPLASNPAACKNHDGTVTKYVPDQKTCMGYYICQSKDGPGTWDKCPHGLHFNNGECVTPYSFACAYDRCANIGQQFVGAVGTQCHHYLFCKNETSQAQAGNYIDYVGLRCANNLYFNEFTQRCEDTSPATETYKLCPVIKN